MKDLAQCVFGSVAPLNPPTLGGVLDEPSSFLPDSAKTRGGGIPAAFLFRSPPPRQSSQPTPIPLPGSPPKKIETKTNQLLRAFVGGQGPWPQHFLGQ